MAREATGGWDAVGSATGSGTAGAGAESWTADVSPAEHKRSILVSGALQCAKHQ